MENLPIYEVTVSKEYQTGEEELGMDQIAFTNDPAILVKGVAFRSQEQKKLFADDKKYRITAPAMIPMDIYRADESGEYEVRFTEKEIENIHSKFMANLTNKDLFNVEHNEEDKAPAYILEAWIVDKPKEDKAYSSFGIQVPKGSLMLTAQITDKDFYNKIVESGAFGFSIEAFLGLKEPTKLSNNLNTNNMTLPNGKFTLDGKEYEVIDGKVTEVQLAEVDNEAVASTEVEAEAETEAVAEPVAEVAEVEMMEDGEKPEEEAEMMEKPKEEEMAVDPEMDAEAIQSIVQPMLDAAMAEVLQVIAELKEEMGESVEEAPAEDAEVNMSASLGFKRMHDAFYNNK